MRILGLIVLQALAFGCKTTDSQVKAGPALKLDAEELKIFLDPQTPENDEESRNLIACRGPSERAPGTTVYMFFLQIDGQYRVDVAENLEGRPKNMFPLLKRAICTRPVASGSDKLKSMNCTSVENKAETLAIAVSKGNHVLTYSAPLGRANSQFAEVIRGVEKDGKVSFAQMTFPGLACHFDAKLEGYLDWISKKKK